MSRFFSPILFALLLAASIFSAHAGTKVRIATPIGNIDLELYDADKPVTVQNFLKYVQSGRYAKSFSHRLVPGFAFQSGGFSLSGTSVNAVTTDAPIVNEYATGTVYSNLKGTIAMAKVDGDPDSATSQWFLNLAHNGTNLDTQNGGFTVFGHVIAGMDVLEKFNTSFGNAATGGWGVYDASGALGQAFTEMPLLANQLTTDNVIYTTISVLPDAAPSSSDGGSPTVAVKGGTKFVTKAAAAKVAGTASPTVSLLEWRLGTKGAFRKATAGATWRLRVPGLKRGLNFLFVRGVSASGQSGNTLKIRITRK
jgi:cyclophilin family peptidyl-prolyl cis-trans isomerase